MCPNPVRAAATSSGRRRRRPPAPVPQRWRSPSAGQRVLGRATSFRRPRAGIGQRAADDDPLADLGRLLGRRAPLAGPARPGRGRAGGPGSSGSVTRPVQQVRASGLPRPLWGPGHVQHIVQELEGQPDLLAEQRQAQRRDLRRPAHPARRPLGTGPPSSAGSAPDSAPPTPPRRRRPPAASAHPGPARRWPGRGPGRRPRTRTRGQLGKGPGEQKIPGGDGHRAPAGGENGGPAPPQVQSHPARRRGPGWPRGRAPRPPPLGRAPRSPAAARPRPGQTSSGPQPLAAGGDHLDRRVPARTAPCPLASSTIRRSVRSSRRASGLAADLDHVCDSPGRHAAAPCPTWMAMMPAAVCSQRTSRRPDVPHQLGQGRRRREASHRAGQVAVGLDVPEPDVPARGTIASNQSSRRWTAGAAVAVVISRTTTRPPGRITRTISSTPRRRSAKLRAPKPTVTASKECRRRAELKGVGCSQSRTRQPRPGALARASSSISLARSRCPRPLRRAHPPRPAQAPDHPCRWPHRAPGRPWATAASSAARRRQRWCSPAVMTVFIRSYRPAIRSNMARTSGSSSTPGPPVPESGSTAVPLAADCRRADVRPRRY